MTASLGDLGRALLEALLPDACAACGGPVVDGPHGPRVTGLRWCDGPALCIECEKHLLRPEPRAGRIGDGDDTLCVYAGRTTDAELVGLVGTWKYRGRRGLAWPLAGLAAAGWPSDVEPGRLVPLPLHVGRRRERGFNQAALLAHLLAGPLRTSQVADVLRRVRATPQQAKLAAKGDARRRNVAGAFAARVPRPGEPRELTLVDDLVTSGATCLAAAASLSRAGWCVRTVATTGLAPAVEGACLTASAGVPNIPSLHRAHGLERGMSR